MHHCSCITTLQATRSYDKTIMTEKHSLLLILALFILSSDALPINVTSQGDLTGLCGVLDAKEKLFKLGITSDYSSSRGSVLTTWADMNAAGLTKSVCQDGYQKNLE